MLPLEATVRLKFREDSQQTHSADRPTAPLRAAVARPLMGGVRAQDEPSRSNSFPRSGNLFRMDTVREPRDRRTAKSRTETVCGHRSANEFSTLVATVRTVGT